MSDFSDWTESYTQVASLSGDTPDWTQMASIVGGGGGGTDNATILDFALDGSWVQTVPWSLTFATSGYINGQVTLGVITVLKSITVTKTIVNVNSANAVVADENYIGLYSWAKATGDLTLVGATAAGACDSSFSATNAVFASINLSASVVLSAGVTYYGAILTNATVAGTPPVFSQIPSGYLSHTTTPAGAPLYGTSIATNLTALPATILAAAWSPNAYPGPGIPQLAFSP